MSQRFTPAQIALLRQVFISELEGVKRGDGLSTLVNDLGFPQPGEYARSGDPVSIFQNDAQYLIPGDPVSLLDNDAGYLTVADLPQPLPYALVRDVKAAGQGGGDITHPGVWHTRDLTELTASDIPGVELSASQITLPAGRYRISASAPAYGNVFSHVAILYNVDGAQIVLVGTAERTRATVSGTYCSTRSFVKGVVQITTPQRFEIQHQSSTDETEVYSWGAAANMGIPEVYTVVEIWKL